MIKREKIDELLNLPADERRQVRRHSDANLDFVVVATAERLNITRLLTLDRRDFQLIRPKHCSSFELLP
jgi:predicted nucleic acid-binding protein